MVELDEFYDSIYKLSNSLVIKMKDVAIANNNYALLKGVYVSPDDVRSWRYFMNLAGEIHPSNNNVEITLMETGETVSLTKEVLKTHPYTKKELLKCDEYYNLLVDKYPEDILYIHGCMYPVDIYTAIHAEDGTILAYNKDFVEDAELSLIRELEIYTKNFIRRWYINEVTIIEQLYLPAFLGILYTSLPNKIFNIRLGKVYSSEVHSFHLEHFFRSKYNIWNNVQVLNKKSLYWLYRNMNYIRKHVGKQKTFDIILDKIYDANSVGVGEYMVRIPDAKLDEENENDLEESSFKRDDASSITSALNKNYILDNNEEVPIPSLVGMELETTKGTGIINQEMSNFIQEETAKEMQGNLQDNVKTKTLDINGLKLFRTNGTDIVSLALDYWMYSLKNGNFSSILLGKDDDGNTIWEEPFIEYIEPNDKKVYNVKPSVGFLMALKVLLMITKNTNKKLRTTTYTTVINSDTDVFDNVEPMFDGDGYIQGLLPMMKEVLPWKLGKITHPEVFGEYLNYVFKYHEFLWILDSNSENILVSSNLKLLFKRMRIRGNYSLSSTYKTIDQLLEENEVDYVLNEGYNLQESFFKIIKTFTTLFVDPYEIIRNTMIDYVEILNKITSYTTHTVLSTRDDTTNPLFYNNLGVYLSKTGIVNITRGELIPLNQVYFEVKAAANDFVDVGVVSYDSPIFVYLRACEPLYMLGYTDNVEYSDSPKVMMKLYRIEDYFFNRCNCKEIPIKGVTAVWTPCEDHNLWIKASYINQNDIITASFNQRTMFIHAYDDYAEIAAFDIDVYETLSRPILYGYVNPVPYKLLYPMEFGNNDYLMLKGVTSVWYPLGIHKLKSKAASNNMVDKIMVGINQNTMFLTATDVETKLEGVTALWNPYSEFHTDLEEFTINQIDEYSVSIHPNSPFIISEEVISNFKGVTAFFGQENLGDFVTKASAVSISEVTNVAYDYLPEYKFLAPTTTKIKLLGATVHVGQNDPGIAESFGINMEDNIYGSVFDYTKQSLNSELSYLPTISGVTSVVGNAELLAKAKAIYVDNMDTVYNAVHCDIRNIGLNAATIPTKIDCASIYFGNSPFSGHITTGYDVNMNTVYNGVIDNINSAVLNESILHIPITHVTAQYTNYEIGSVTTGSNNVPNNINAEVFDLNTNVLNMNTIDVPVTSITSHYGNNDIGVISSDSKVVHGVAEVAVYDTIENKPEIFSNLLPTLSSNVSFSYRLNDGSGNLDSYAYRDDVTAVNRTDGENVNIIINKRRVKSYGLTLAGYERVNDRYVKKITTGYDILKRDAASTSTGSNMVEMGSVYDVNAPKIEIDAFVSETNSLEGVTGEIDPLNELYIPEPVFESFKIIKDVEDD